MSLMYIIDNDGKVAMIFMCGKYVRENAMLRNAVAINGYAIVASDGRLGHVSDLLFDDSSWLVRWLVVDTGNWRTDRKVLLPPAVLGRVDPLEREFSVGLTMRQVEASPDLDTDQSVSRQMETHIYDYYGWSPYWGTGFSPGGDGYMPTAGTVAPSLRSWWRDGDVGAARRGEGDPHLRSAKAVTGYHILASDGEIGHVEDFLIDDADWGIHFLVVDTKNWWPGKKVLISPGAAQEIDWSSDLVKLEVDRQMIKSAPPYDSATTVDAAYERSVHDHYGDDPRCDRPTPGTGASLSAE